MSKLNAEVSSRQRPFSVVSFIRRSAAFHWRGHLCLALSVAACMAVLVGALTVGDTVRHTLRTLAGQRIGSIRFALSTGNRLFRARLADETRTVPMLDLPGVAANDDGSRRVNRVRVIGVDARFGALAAAPGFPTPDAEAAVVSRALAQRLNVQVGDDLVVRVAKTGMSGELALAATREAAVAFRARIQAVVEDGQGGRFGLENTQVPPLNVFVSLSRLQTELECPGKANGLLAGAEFESLEQANQALQRFWSPADVGLEVREVPNGGQTEVRSTGLFLDDAAARAALAVSTQSVGVLCYLVNAITADGRETPYSFVAGMTVPPCGPVPGAGETTITEWLAKDLGAGVGAVLRFRYFVVGPLRTLVETSAVFRVAAVLPMREGADPTLMPEIPGVSESESCRDWESGLPLDLGRIRPEDEAYWRDWRGAPKAFISLESAQGLWSNRWGALTSVRYPAAAGTVPAVTARLNEALGAGARPVFRPVREAAVRSGSQAMDFGQLFLGLSLFLFIATMLMMALLFRLVVEQRLEQTGLLLAVGLGRKPVRHALAIENALPTFGGMLLGLAAGLAYAKGLIAGFERLWQPAGSLHLVFSVSGQSLAVAAGAVLVVAWGGHRLAMRRALAQPVRALLNRVEAEPSAAHRWLSHRLWIVLGIAALALAGVTAWLGRGADGEEKVGLFFATGSCLLVVGVGAVRWFVDTWGMKAPNPLVDRADLARRNAGRHPVRSLSITGTVACAVFLLTVVVAFEPYEPDPRSRLAGTGGFALTLETAMPVCADLNTVAGQRAYGLPAERLRGVRLVGLRVRPGDDASCENLARAQEPRLAGVNPGALAERGAFAFLKTLPPGRVGGSLGAGRAAKPDKGEAAAKGLAALPEKGLSPWRLLEEDWGTDVVPAMADETTLMWGLEKAVGDELAYVDERGRPFRVRIVGMVKNSVLQGSLLVPEKDILERYPSLAGYSQFLVDVPEGQESGVAEVLTRHLRDQGAVVMPAAARLAELGAVTVMYLKLFQTLGGLGLLLGVVAVSAMVLRSAFERRGELAALRALGFTRRDVAGLLVGEQVWLVGWGLAVGVASALAAIWPVMEGRELVSALWPGLAVMLAGVGLCGLAASAVAAWAATRVSPLEALREE